MINSVQLFEMALGVQSPWKIEGVDFVDSSSGQELHIRIDFKKGTKFPDETSVSLCSLKILGRRGP